MNVCEMDIAIILIALGLAIDSFSVSITRGFTYTKTKLIIEALKTGFLRSSLLRLVVSISK